MYAIPKFHKIPTKFRFITSSVNCITKDISVLLNLILNELSNKVELESEFSWIIKNNRKVLKSLEECNANPGVPGNHMLTTFDFSTLYTALPHDDLIRCLVALLELCTIPRKLLFLKMILFRFLNFVFVIVLSCMIIRYLDK